MEIEEKTKFTVQGSRKKPNIALEESHHIKGRAKTGEPYQKVTICLFEKHVLFLDKIVLAIREKTGKRIKRAELVRALVDNAARMMNPGHDDFENQVKILFTGQGK